MTKDFPQILSNYQKKIDKELKKFFNKKISQIKQPFLKEVLALLREFSSRPAKRIRPILVNQGYFLAGGKNRKAILETSIFIELIHNFLLIHDDIIDRDKVRRGKPTVHCYYKKLFASNKREREHYGQSMAIVAGDLAAALGYEILASASFPAKYKNRAIEKLNQIIYAACCGQMLELCLREKMRLGKKINENDIFEIYRSKTAPYGFVGPLQIGAILAGANEGFLKKIEKFALPLGITFQIQDDIHEVFSSTKEIQKPMGSDIKEGQPNLLILKVLENKREAKNLRKYLGRTNLNQSELKEIKKIIIKSGSLQYCQKVSEKLIAQVKKSLILEKKFPQKEKQFLLNSADYIIAK